MFLNLYLLKSLYKEHLENEKGALIPMDGIVAFIVGTLIGVAIHSYIKKERNRPNVIKLRTPIGKYRCPLFYSSKKIATTSIRIARAKSGLDTDKNQCYIFNEKRWNNCIDNITSIWAGFEVFYESIN